MKNQGKAGLWLLGAVVVGALGYWIFRRSKKTYAELDRRDKEAKEVLKKSGLSEEEILIGDERDLDEPPCGYNGNDANDIEQVDDDINLCERLFHDCRFVSDDLPVEAVEAIDIVANHNDAGNRNKRIVHVMQDFARRENRNVLDFIFEVPLSAISKDSRYSDGNLRVGDFSRALRGRWDHENGTQAESGFSQVMEDIVRDPENLGINISSGKFVYCPGWIEAWGNIAYERRFEDGTWKKAYRTVKLDKTLIENNPFNPEHTTASDFVADLKREYAETDGMRIGLQPTTEDYRDCKVLDAFLGIRVSFFIQDKYHMDGINPNSGLKIIEEIYNSLEISDLNEKEVFNYDKFLFYDPNLLDDVRVYTDGDNNVIESIPLFHD